MKARFASMWRSLKRHRWFVRATFYLIDIRARVLSGVSAVPRRRYWSQRPASTLWLVSSLASDVTDAPNVTDWTGDWGRGSAPRPLLPRYRRLLTFGAILDETFRVFRSAWVPLMLVLAISAIPITLLNVVLQGLGLSALLSEASVDLAMEDAEAFLDGFGRFGVAMLLASGLTVVLTLPSIAAVAVVTDGVIRGARPLVWGAFLAGIRAWPALIAASALVALAVILLWGVAIPFFVAGIFGTLGSLVALVALLVWWGNPRARRRWVKWLIILATPFGLPLYFGLPWMLAYVVIPLERVGPVRALRRSARLTRGNWFRVAGTVSVLSLVASFLQAIPSWIAGLVMAVALVPVADAFEAPDSMVSYTLFSNVIQIASSWLGWVIFGALPFIGLALLFTDLRNRHEGADLAERLSLLDTARS
jgi:hypothetical protein